MTKPERWIAIILLAFSTMFLGQVALNTAPEPEAPCINLTFEGAEPCAATP